MAPVGCKCDTVVRMRTPLVLLVLAAAPLPLGTACGGGGKAQNGANAPSASDSDSSGAVAADTTDAGPTTTTTVTIPDGGDLQGAKLTETHTVASTSGSSAPPKGPHTHDPGRSPEDIKAIVVAHRPEARACYDKALPAHPGMQGDLVIQWTIDAKGNVTKISLDTARSTITEPSVVSCVSDIIKAIQFAQSPGGFETNAMYPFKFTPKGGH